MTHLIHRQIVELHLPNAATATQQQAAWHRLWNEHLGTALDRVLTDLSPADGSTLRLDNLTVELGIIAADIFHQPENFSVYVQGCLREALTKALDTEGGRQRRQQDDLTSFVHFIRTGRAAWWFRNASDFDPKILFRKVVSTQAEQLYHALAAIYTERSVATRLAIQLSIEDIQTFAQKLNREDTEGWHFLKNWYEHAFNNTLTALSQKNYWLDIILQPDKSFAWFVFFEEHIKPQSLDIPQSLRNFLDKTQPQWTSEIQQRVKTWIEKTDFSTVTGRGRRVENTVSNYSNQGYSGTPILVEDLSIYIENAGLVLLAPFLPLLFDTLKWTENERFSTIEHQKRAVLLTSYLTDSNISGTVKEHSLMLNKILCGYSIEDPLPDQYEPTDMEKQEIAELMDSVIVYWSAVLVGATPEILQQSFLMRKGKLTETDHGWTMLVERTGLDILMDISPPPWSFSFIFHNWMPKPLYVEW